MDKLKAVKNEVNQRNWSEMVQERMESGLTVKEWCINNGINVKTYYYRLKKVREHLCEAKEHHDIVPAVFECSNEPGIEIRIGNAEITVHSGADKDTLCCILNMLMNV